MFIFLILRLSINEASAFDLSPGNPLPHADVLESIIRSQFGNGSESNGLLFHYLEGEDYAVDEDDINVNILDITSFRKLITIFKKRYEKKVTDAQSGRNTSIKAERRQERIPQSINNTIAPLLIPKSFNMMQQSIYATRYRLQDTNFYRNRYKNEAAYNIAILVGSMDQILMKMDNLFREMQELHKTKTHFLWYLIIYEKLLTMNVDVGYMARRIWALHNTFLDTMGESEPPDDGQDTRPDVIRNPAQEERQVPGEIGRPQAGGGGSHIL